MARKGCTAGQLTLAWLLTRGESVFPIPGTKKVKYLEETVGALKLELSTDDERELREVIDGADVAGSRGITVNEFADTPEL